MRVGSALTNLQCELAVTALCCRARHARAVVKLLARYDALDPLDELQRLRPSLHYGCVGAMSRHHRLS